MVAMGNEINGSFTLGIAGAGAAIGVGMVGEGAPRRSDATPAPSVTS